MLYLRNGIERESERKPDDEGIVIVNMALRNEVSTLLARGIASLEVFAA